MIINPTVREDEEGRWDVTSEDELEWWPRVLWLDPGETSGVACVWFDPVALMTGAPTPRCVLAWWETYLAGEEDEQVDRLLDIARTLGGRPGAELSGLSQGVESFVPLQINMDKVFLAPVRIRAKWEYAVRNQWGEQHRMGRIAAQSPSDALSTITDHRLKLWDMYTPGPDHIRDATRHCLLWIRKLRNAGYAGMRRWHGWERGWVD